MSKKCEKSKCIHITEFQSTLFAWKTSIGWLEPIKTLPQKYVCKYCPECGERLDERKT